MKVREFGVLNGKIVKAYTLESQTVCAEILTYGGIIRSITVPDKNGKKTDVVLGFDNLESYLSQDAYIGAIVGRVGNRIENGEFTLNGKKYKVGINDKGNSLHGGVIGFDKKIWDAKVEGEKLFLSAFSPNGEEGFPGNLNVTVAYSIENGGLRIEYFAKADADTPINLTNHSYFNLSGEGTESCLDTVLSIKSDKIIPVDQKLIPHGEFMDVKGTPFDFNRPKEIGENIDDKNVVLENCGGYDVTFAIKDDEGASVTALSKKSGIKMQVYTDQKGVQLYTGNFLDIEKGKSGRYGKRSAFCLETQNYPNAVNCPEYPDSILRKGQEYKTFTEFRFSIER